MTAKEPCEEDRLGRINLRPLLFCALSLFFGITLYLSIVFGKVSLPNFIFYAMFFCIALIPFSPRRMLFALSALLLFGGIGALSAHLCFSRFTSAQGGTYEIVGTVESCAVQNGYSDAVLCDLSFDGEARAGKMAVRFSSEEVGTGDIVLFEGEVETAEAEGSYGEYLFSEGIRYTASGDYRVIGKTRNVLLRLNARLHERLGAGMGKEEAQVAYALLTGNSSAMDEGLLTAVRRGGIAHIFAVSGLHIGILYAAISFLARPLGKFSFLPASAVTLLYTAFCGFTASSVRAFVMCASLGICRAAGQKYDFLESISLAAILILLFSPASAVATGFLLSFGACIGLALWGGPLRRAFRRLKFFGNYLAAYLSVQTLTFPVLMDSFGYFSLWGILLNFFLLPALPVLFLTLLLFSAAAMALPLSAVGILIVPEGLLSLFLLLFSSMEFSLVLSGFSLGAGAAVWTAGMVLLSGRVRLGRAARAGLGAAFCFLFGLCLVFENISVRGRGYVMSRGEGDVAFIEAGNTAVLVIDSDASLSLCEEILSRCYSGKLDAVIVVGEDDLAAINIAAALHPERICAYRARETGLRAQEVSFAEGHRFGALDFRYVGKDRLFLTAYGVSVEFGFENSALGGDFFLPAGSDGLKFSFGNGIIRT